MKKIFIVLAVASLGFVACNNAAENEATEDTLSLSTDTVATPAIDTLATTVDSAALNANPAATIVDSAAQ